MSHSHARFVVWTAILIVGAAARPIFAQSSAIAPPTQSTPAPNAQVQQLRDDLSRLRAEFDAVRAQYDDRISAIERLLSQLSGPTVVSLSEPPPPDESPAPQDPAQTAAPLPQQNMAGASKVFNPDSSIIANFIGVAGKNPLSDQPSMQVSEVEAAFQAIVDPYARADFFLSAGPDGLEIEEGFMTFNTLPAHLLLKVGKMRASFGKVNTLHTHAMPTADRPLVTNNLVGGEEGISDAGLSLAHLIPMSALFLEVTGEVFRGDSAVFQSSERSRLNYVARVRGYRDITESSNLDLGVSIATGPTDVGVEANNELNPVSNETNRRLVGIDATFRYRPLRRAIYTRFNLRTELVWSRQDIPDGTLANAFGMYVLGEYQFARRWYAGARLDQSERAFDASLKDNGGSLFLTYWPSEFSQIRGQYRRTNYAEGVHANEFMLQFNFSIGAHGAHVF